MTPFELGANTGILVKDIILYALGFYLSYKLYKKWKEKKEED